MALFEVHGLTHAFGGLQAVNDFNLTLEGGELVGLIGPNGAGKTTVFNLVCGIYRPSGGTIRINGKTLNGLHPHQVTASGIARTFQNIRLWPTLTVLDNVRMAQPLPLRLWPLGYPSADRPLPDGRKSKPPTPPGIADPVGIGGL